MHDISVCMCTHDSHILVIKLDLGPLYSVCSNAVCVCVCVCACACVCVCACACVLQKFYI